MARSHVEILARRRGKGGTPLKRATPEPREHAALPPRKALSRGDPSRERGLEVGKIGTGRVRCVLAAAAFMALAAGIGPLPALANGPGLLETGDPMQTWSATTANAGPDILTAEGSSVSLSGSATPGSAYGPLWSDNFDSYPLGPLSPPWTGSTGGPNYAEISNTIVHGPSGQSLHLVDPDLTLGTGADRDIGSVTSLDMTVWAYALQTTGVFTPIASGGASPEAWQAMRAGMGPSGSFIYRVCSAGWTTSAVPYIAGRWYEMRFVASTLTDTYDFYVDGSLVSGGISLCIPVSAFTTVRMVSAGSYVGEFYVDDVSLDAEQPVTITEYAWDLNGARDEDFDGNFTNDKDRLGATANAPYGDSGDYLVTLTVTDSSGARANDTLVVSVANLPPEIATIPDSPVSITTGGNLTIDVWDAGSDDLAIAWFWSDGPTGGTVYQNGPTPDPPLSPWGTFPFIATHSEFRMFPAPGIYTVTVVVGDDDGGVNGTQAQVDVRNVPESTLTIGPPTYAGAYTFVNDSTAFALSAADRSGFGIVATRYRIDGGAWTLYTLPFALGTRGVHTIEYWSTDGLGGVEAAKSAIVYVDLDPPITILSVTGPQLILGGTTWITPATTLAIGASDSESGLGATWHRIWDGITWSPWTNVPLSPSPPVSVGPFLLEAYSTDNLGQPESVSSYSFIVDGGVPVSALSVGTPLYGNWLTDATPLTLSAIDGSGVGVALIEYRIWYAGAWGAVTPYSSPFFLVAGEGLYHVEHRAADLLGNQEAWRNESFLVDLTPPTSSLGTGLPLYGSWVTDATPFTLSASDGGVGLDRIWYRVFHAGTWGLLTEFGGPFTLMSGEGQYTIEFHSVDLLGNTETVSSESFTLDVTPPASSLSAGTPAVAAWVTDATPFGLSATDGPGAGVDGIDYRTWHAGVWASVARYTSPFFLTAGEGLFYLEYRAVDLLGTAEPWRNDSYTVDVSPPSSTFSAGEPLHEDWVSSATPFDLMAADAGVGLNGIWYRISYGGSWGAPTWYAAPFTLTSGEGLYLIEFYAVDLLGNSEPAQRMSWRVDATPPSITPQLSYSDAEFAFTVSLEVTDSGSGVSRIQYRVGGGAWEEYLGPFMIRGKAASQIDARASDFVGNENQIGPLAYAPTYVNYKPVLSIVLVVLLVFAALVILRRRKSAGRLPYAITGAFAAVEAAIGIASLSWDVLLFPPLFGPGLFVNVTIVAAGIVAAAVIPPKSAPA